MNIYFHIDELYRDAVVASSLKKKFALQGHNLVYGCRSAKWLVKHFHNAFDVIIMPRPLMIYGNWGKDILSWNTHFVILATENLGIIAKDHLYSAVKYLEREYFEGNKQYVSKIDAFCVWGRKQMQAIEEYAGEVSNKCHVVGHPRHDHTCLPNEGYVPVSNKSSTKGVIGITTRAVALNNYFRRSPMMWFSAFLSDRVKYEFFNTNTGEFLLSPQPRVSRPADTLIAQSIDIQNILRIIGELLKNGYEVSLRVHPKENSDVWQQLLNQCGLKVDVSNPKQPMTFWLSTMKYVIGPASTSFYDALMLGVTPISTCSLDPRRKACIGELQEENNNLMQHVFKPKSISELIQYIESGSQNDDNPDLFDVLRQEADYPDCSDSLNKVVAVCCSSVTRSINRRIYLYMYKASALLYFSLLTLRNTLIKRKESSVNFSMDFRQIRFIDDLVQV